jgi:hypothetical protein
MQQLLLSLFLAGPDYGCRNDCFLAMIKPNPRLEEGDYLLGLIDIPTIRLLNIESANHELGILLPQLAYLGFNPGTVETASAEKEE